MKAGNYFTDPHTVKAGLKKNKCVVLWRNGNIRETEGQPFPKLFFFIFMDAMNKQD